MMNRLKFLVETLDRFFVPRTILRCSALAGVILMLLFLFFGNSIYRDVAGCYAYYAREWGRGVWLGAPISALPPLIIFLGGLLVRCGVEAYGAVISLSALFYVLTIFPLYGLLRRFTSDKMAAWGTLLFILAPKLIRFAGMGLLEASRDFFMVLALYLLFRILDDRRRWPLLLLFGASLGLMTMSRGEGIAGALLLLGVLPVLVWRRNRYSLRALWRCALPFFLLAVLGMLAVTAPRLIESYRLVGYPVPDSRLISVLKQLPVMPRLFEDRRPELFPAVTTPRAESPAQREPVSERLLNSAGNLLRGAYEFYIVFAVLGMILVIRRRQWREEYTVFALIFAVYLPVFYVTSSAYRYYVFAIPLLLIFTLFGIAAVLKWVERFRLREVALAGLCLVLGAQIVNGVDILWEEDDLYDLAQWVNANPALHSSQRPVVHADDLPEVVFYLDAKRRFEYSAPVESYSTVTGCDLIMVYPGNREAVAELRRRADLTEVTQPFEEEAAVFMRKKTGGAL